MGCVELLSILKRLPLNLVSLEPRPMKLKPIL